MYFSLLYSKKYNGCSLDTQIHDSLDLHFHTQKILHINLDLTKFNRSASESKESHLDPIH